MVNVVKQIIKISGTYPADTSSHTETISPALSDLSKCIVWISFDYDATNDHSDTFRSWELTDTTTLTIFGEAGLATGNIALNFEATIIEFTSDSTISVQHSDLSVAGGEPEGEITQTISSVTTAETSLFRRGESHDVDETTIGSEELARIRLVSSTTWGWLVDDTPNTGPNQSKVSVADWNDSGILAQRGLVTLPANTGSVTVSPPTSIDRTRTILQISFTSTNGDLTAETDGFALRATIDSNNDIIITRQDNDAITAVDVAWEVTQFPVNVIRVQYPSTISQGTGVLDTTASITSVNTLSHSTVTSPVTTPFGDGNGSCDTDTDGNYDDSCFSLTFDDVSTIRAIRGGADDGGQIEAMIVEWTVRESKTFTVDARLTMREEFTCDAILLTTFDEPFSCDSFLKATFDKTFTCDAILKATFNTNFLVDSLVMELESKSFSVNALVEKTFDETFLIDAKLNKVSEFTIDALLNKVADFTVDSKVIIRRDEEFTIDSYLVRNEHFDVNAILRRIQTEEFTIDVYLQKEKDKTYLIDSLLKEEFSFIYIIDSLLELRQSETFIVDSRLRKVQDENFLIDSLVKLIQTESYTVDARLSKIKTFKTDGLVIKAVQFKVDALPQKVTDKTFTIDGLPFIPPAVLINVNSILIVRNTEDFILDSFVRLSQTKTFLVDSLLKKTLDKTFLIDANFETPNTKTFIVDAIRRATFTKTPLVDALLKKTLTKTVIIDAVFEEAFTKTFTIDGLKEDTFDETTTIDAELVNRFDETFTVDAYLIATQNFNFTVDGLPFTPPSVLITIDAEIIISGIESFTVDARVELTSSLVSTVDAILKATFTETFTIDSTIHLPIYEPFNVDALLEQIKTKTFTIDTILEQAKIKIFTIDSILTPTGITVENFLVDARLSSTQDETFTVQARIRFVNDNPFTIDAVLKMTGDTLCSVLTPIFSDDFTTSTGWTTSGDISVDSLANPDVLRYNGVSSPNPGDQAIKTLSIPTGEEFRIEFKHINNGNLSNGFGSYASFGLTDTTTRIGHISTAVPKLEYRVNANDGPNGEGIRIRYRATVSDPELGSASAIPMIDNTTYYVRIDKNLASIITLSMFSDPARTIHVSGSPIQLDVSSQIKVPFLYVQASNVGPPGPGSARIYTGIIDDLVIYEDRCPNFLIDSVLQKEQEKTFNINAKLVFEVKVEADALLKQRKTKTFTIDTFTNAPIQGIFTIDALLVRINQFSLDALIKALGDNRCLFENIFEEHFTTTSNWTVEINNTTVDGWGAQKIFIDGESLLSQEGIAHITMPPGGFSGAMQPILKSKYRRKKLDSEGGIGKVRGNNIRLDLELTYLSGARGKFIVLNKSSLHPNNDPNTSTLNLNAGDGGAGKISVTLDDGVNNTTTPSIDVGTGTKRFISIESLGNTLTLNVYIDEAHTTHLAGSPVNVDTSSVNKDQLDLSWLIIGANDKNAGTANPDTVGKVDNIKIFSSPCPVAYVDGYLTQFFIETFNIDARLVRPQRFTIDAIIQGRKFATVDAIIVRERSIIIDAILKRIINKTFTVDPLLIGEVNENFTIDGIPFVPPAVLTTVDSIVNFQDVNKVFNINAILLEGNLFTLTTDAIIIQLTINKQFNVDARIRERKTQLPFVDGLVKMLGENGVCNFQPEPFFGIDTGLEQFIGPITPEHEQGVDLLIGQEVVLNNQQIRSVTLLLRATGFPNEIIEDSLIVGKIWGNVVVGNPDGETVEATSENTINARNISGDLPPSVWKEVIFTYNPLTTPFLTGNYVIGLQHFVGPNTNDPQGVGIAIPVISDSNVISGSAVTRREDNSIIDPLTWMYLTSVSKDIVIRVEVVNGNDIIQGISKQCPRVDASLRNIFNSKTFTVDAIIDNFKQKFFTIDVILQKIKEFIVDVFLSGKAEAKIDARLIPSPVVYKVDAILLVEPGKVFNVNAILESTFIESFFVDARVKTTINKIFNCNAILSIPDKIKTFTIDAKTQFFNLVSPFKVDGLVIKFPSELIFVNGVIKALNKQKLFRIDALAKRPKIEAEFDINARLRQTQIKSLLIDAKLIAKDKIKTFEITASLAVTQPPILFTVDAFTRKDNVRHRIDALLRLRKTKTTLTDSILSNRFDETFTIDGLIKDFDRQQIVIVDALTRRQTDLQFIVDAGIRELGSLFTFDVNARVIFPFKKPKVDARVVNRREKLFLVDSFIDPPFTVKPKVDALVKCLSCSGNAFCTNTFTIDARIGIGEKTVTINAKLNKIKPFTIDAMTVELIDVGIEAESVISEGSGDVGFESTFGIGGTQ